MATLAAEMTVLEHDLIPLDQNATDISQVGRYELIGTVEADCIHEQDSSAYYPQEHHICIR